MKMSEPKRTILVVEDESTICRVCELTLSAEGFEVDIAPNGKKAQDFLNKKDYNLVLIDMRTPDLNSKELYEWIRINHPVFGKRIIFTTGDLLEGASSGFIEASGRPLLPKPFRPDELIATVKEAWTSLENV